MNEIELTLKHGNDLGLSRNVSRHEAGEILVARDSINDLTAAERERVEKFALSIDLLDATAISTYGDEAQKNSARFSDQILGSTSTRDVDQIGEMLANLVEEMNKRDPSKKPKFGILGFLMKPKEKIQRLHTEYTSIGKNLDKISAQLDSQRIQLLADDEMLDGLFESNFEHLKELVMYIEAAKIALRKAREEDLPTLQAKATETGSAEDAFRAKDFEDAISRLDKKVYDLELTRTVCFQMAPQIRTAQATDRELSDKLQSVIANVIPLWKKNAAMAIAIERSRQALEATKAVRKATNEMMQAASQQLKENAIGAARESQAGIVDLETLEKNAADIQDVLIQTLEIQRRGVADRRKLEAHLAEIEDKTRKVLTGETSTQNVLSGESGRYSLTS